MMGKIVYSLQLTVYGKMDSCLRRNDIILLELLKRIPYEYKVS